MPGEATHSSFTLCRTVSMAPGMRRRIDAENLWSWGGAGKKYEPDPKVIGEAGMREVGNPGSNFEAETGGKLGTDLETGRG